MNIYPDFGAFGDNTTLQTVIGALLTFVLVTAVLTMLISGITWAGGDLYYAVDDNDGKLYPLTLTTSLVGAVSGRALYEGTLNLEEANAWVAAQ